LRCPACASKHIHMPHMHATGLAILHSKDKKKGDIMKQ
jgi:hypothetical protein